MTNESKITFPRIYQKKKGSALIKPLIKTVKIQSTL